MFKPLSLLTLLLSMASSASAADQWAQSSVVTVVMTDNRFQPDHLTFQQGKAYQLRLENHGKDMHEFTAGAFFRASTVRDKNVLANGGTDVVVQPGKSVDVFLIAPKNGSYDLTCADHDWDGMIGGISVN